MQHLVMIEITKAVVHKQYIWSLIDYANPLLPSTLTETLHNILQIMQKKDLKVIRDWRATKLHLHHKPKVLILP